MGRFVECADRSQVTFLPECLDDWVGDNNPVYAPAGSSELDYELELGLVISQGGDIVRGAVALFQRPSPIAFFPRRKVTVPPVSNFPSLSTFTSTESTCRPGGIVSVEETR